MEPRPLTNEQIVAASALVSMARLVSVAEGRVIDFKEGTSHPIYTSVLGFENIRTVKGSGSKMVYVEVIRGGVSADQLKAVAPQGAQMLLLLRTPSWSESSYRFIDDGRGVPSGETLLALVYPAGLIVESTKGVEYPFADDPLAPIFRGETLEAVESEILSIVNR